MPKRGEVDLRKLKYWKAILADFEKSGMTGQSYCRQKGLTYERVKQFETLFRVSSHSIMSRSSLGSFGASTPSRFAVGYAQG
jgi:hypothetical protein